MLLIFRIAPLLMIANALIAAFLFQESIKLDSKNIIEESAIIDQRNSKLENSNRVDIIKYQIPVLIPILYLMMTSLQFLK